MSGFVHEMAFVDGGEESIPDGTRIWHFTHVMDSARIGNHVNIGQNCFIDSDVVIGDNCKLQNGVNLYHGVKLEEGVFLGPGVCTTNDRYPRAINPDGSLKSSADWMVSKTLIKRGASIGAGTVIRCGVTIGEWAMVGAGSVVTRDVSDHGLVYGNPARLQGFVCHAGHKMKQGTIDGMLVELVCKECATPRPVLITRAAFGRLR